MRLWHPNRLQWVVIWATFLTASHLSLDLKLSDWLPESGRSWGLFAYLDRADRTPKGRNHLSVVILATGGLILWHFSGRKRPKEVGAGSAGGCASLRKRCELLLQANKALDALRDSEEGTADTEEIQRLQNILDSLTLQAMKEQPPPESEAKTGGLFGLIVLIGIFMLLWMVTDTPERRTSHPVFGAPAFRPARGF